MSDRSVKMSTTAIDLPSTIYLHDDGDTVLWCEHRISDADAAYERVETGAEFATHWTAESFDNFVYRIASDFADYLSERLEERGLTQAAFAAMLGVTEEQVSQMMENPENLSLHLMVKWARALECKVSIVGYDDGDESNTKGPILADIFRDCWVAEGSPRTVDEMND